MPLSHVHTQGQYNYVSVCMSGVCVCVCVCVPKQERKMMLFLKFLVYIINYALKFKTSRASKHRNVNTIKIQ